MSHDSSPSPRCSSPSPTTSTRISPHVSELVREAAGKGAKVILPPELFEGPYFCRTQDEAPFRPRPAGRPRIRRCWRCRQLAAELGVYIPTSFFEAEGHHHYNSLAMIDDKGAVMGVYRKSHIPDGPGLFGEILFPPRQYRLQDLADAATARSASASAGTNGIRRRRAR